MLVQQHAASFIEHTEASTGAELPRFIKHEFDATKSIARDRRHGHRWTRKCSVVCSGRWRS